LRKENITLPEYQDEISQSKGVEAMLKETYGLIKRKLIWRVLYLWDVNQLRRI
jgi:hypothetical protein